MDLYRNLAGAEVGGDLFVEPPGHNVRHDLVLARRQPGVAILQDGELVLLAARDIVSFQYPVDGFEQLLVVERFVKNSIALDFIAFTVVGTSANAVRRRLAR